MGGGCVSSQGLGLEARGARLWEGSGCRVSTTAQAPPATVGVAGAGRGQPGLLWGVSPRAAAGGAAAWPVGGSPAFHSAF